MLAWPEFFSALFELADQWWVLVAAWLLGNSRQASARGHSAGPPLRSAACASVSGGQRTPAWSPVRALTSGPCPDLHRWAQPLPARTCRCDTVSAYDYAELLESLLTDVTALERSTKRVFTM